MAEFHDVLWRILWTLVAVVLVLFVLAVAWPL